MHSVMYFVGGPLDLTKRVIDSWVPPHHYRVPEPECASIGVPDSTEEPAPLCHLYVLGPQLFTNDYVSAWAMLWRGRTR